MIFTKKDLQLFANLYRVGVYWWHAKTIKFAAFPLQKNHRIDPA
jgi:hypothetical protein